MELLTCKYVNSNIFRYFQALLEKLSESRVWPPPFNTTYELKFPLHLLFGSPTDISDNTGPVSYTCSVRWRVPFSERKNDGKRANWGRPAGTARRGACDWWNEWPPRLRKPHSRLSAVIPEGTPIFLLGEQIKSETGPAASHCSSLK